MTRWQSVRRPPLRCWIRKFEETAHYSFIASPKPAPPHVELKPANLTPASPQVGCAPDLPPAASFTPSGPEFTAPELREHKLRKATNANIEAAIDAALTTAAAANEKPPSPRELRDIVLPLLLARGCEATKDRIEDVAQDFKKTNPDRFLPVGKRWR